MHWWSHSWLILARVFMATEEDLWKLLLSADCTCRIGEVGDDARA